MPSTTSARKSVVVRVAPVHATHTAATCAQYFHTWSTIIINKKGGCKALFIYDINSNTQQLEGHDKEGHIRCKRQVRYLLLCVSVS
jgi:hypothetical protein